MKRKKMLLYLIAAILAMAVTCPAYAGTITADVDETIGNLALIDSGGTPHADIVLGLSSDDIQVESPAWVQAYGNYHQETMTAKAVNDETTQQVITWTTKGDDGSSGGSSFHIGKDLASTSTMMNGSYAMPPVTISHVHQFGPALTMIA